MEIPVLLALPPWSPVLDVVVTVAQLQLVFPPAYSLVVLNPLSLLL